MQVLGEMNPCIFTQDRLHVWPVDQDRWLTRAHKPALDRPTFIRMEYFRKLSISGTFCIVLVVATQALDENSYRKYMSMNPHVYWDSVVHLTSRPLLQPLNYLRRLYVICMSFQIGLCHIIKVSLKDIQVTSYTRGQTSLAPVSDRFLNTRIGTIIIKYYRLIVRLLLGCSISGGRLSWNWIWYWCHALVDQTYLISLQ